MGEDDTSSGSRCCNISLLGDGADMHGAQPQLGGRGMHRPPGRIGMEMVTSTGVEPVTYSLGKSRSIQLSYEVFRGAIISRFPSGKGAISASQCHVSS